MWACVVSDGGQFCGPRGMGCRQLTRGDVVLIVVSVMKSLNKEVQEYYSPMNGWIRKAHMRCGMFPYTPTPLNDIGVFRRHLDSLNEDEVYARLSECSQRLELLEGKSDAGDSDPDCEVTDANRVAALRGLEDYYSTEEEDTRALLDMFG
eukprot:GHVU01021387.1.p1 GENE.GHVU01021387.1~~GHVU01021387.1.p1  ORF type:complete len:150 (-),score=16.29 GHVU01021387.1:157-606(-)